jgi:hypothetical protein
MPIERNESKGRARLAILCLRVAPSRNSISNEGAAILLANVVDGADVGVIEGRCGLGFTAKTGEGLRIVGDFFRKKFERHEAVEAGVFRLVNNAHPTAANFFENAIVRDGGT